MRKQCLSLAFAFTLLATAAIAGGENNSKTPTCTSDKTVTTTSPVTSCNTQMVQVPTGATACDIGGQNGSGSADFTGPGTCFDQTVAQAQTSCSTTNVTTSTVVKGNCPASDGCSTGGHNCGHGAGPGG
jgi:hypothetical protein